MLGFGTCALVRMIFWQPTSSPQKREFESPDPNRCKPYCGTPGAYTRVTTYRLWWKSPMARIWSELLLGAINHMWTSGLVPFSYFPRCFAFRTRSTPVQRTMEPRGPSQRQVQTRSPRSVRFPVTTRNMCSFFPMEIRWRFGLIGRNLPFDFVCLRAAVQGTE